MMPKSAWAGAAMILAVVCFAAPAAAETRDSCLVGTWTPTNNGAAEWMARNVPGMNISSSISDGTFTLRSDGSYSASASIVAMARPEGGRGSGRSVGDARAEGYWTAMEGRLVLSPTMEALEGTYELNSEGHTSVVPLEVGPGGPVSYDYSCSGDSFETQLAIPGTADPMIHSYRRASP